MAKLPDLDVVLDHEHAPPVAARRRRLRPAATGSAGAVDLRQVQRERGAAADVAGHVDVAAGLLGEAERPGDRPRPVPLPTSFVVKNGSKMRAERARA